MKEQANELKRQMESFTISETHIRHVSSSTSPGSSTRRHSQPETRNPKRDTPGRAPLRAMASAGVASGNGKDRRVSGDEFEEF
jgi:hypothetical protein